MKYLPFLLFMFSCTPLEMEVAEDIIEGEIKVGEQVLQDVSGVNVHH